MIQIEGVSKDIGNRQILKSVSLEVHPGEVLGLLGPNGAGKTTLMSLVTGTRHPSAGSIKIFGETAGTLPARQKIAVSPQELDFPKTVIVSELVRWFLSLYDRSFQLDNLRQELGGIWDQPLGALSGGQRRSVSLACAFASGASALVLDEPSAGLDYEVRSHLWSRIRDFAKTGGMVLLTTHYLEEAEKLSDRVAILEKGELRAVARVEDLRKRYSSFRVSFAPNSEDPKINGKITLTHWLSETGLLSTKKVTSHSQDSGQWTLFTSHPDFVVRKVVESLPGFSGLRIEATSLEEVIHEIRGRQ